jgi:hypothetical protein
MTLRLAGKLSLREWDEGDHDTITLYCGDTVVAKWAEKEVGDQLVRLRYWIANGEESVLRLSEPVKSRARQPVPTPPRLNVGRRSGRCFELAGRAQVSVDSTWTLIHGRAALAATMPQLLFAHAWLQKSGYVYDPVLDRVLPAKDYALEYRVIVERRYSAARASQMALSSQHWGPWHSSDAVVLSDRVVRKRRANR